MTKSIAILLAGIFSLLSIAQAPLGANSVQEAVSVQEEAISVFREKATVRIVVAAAEAESREEVEEIIVPSTSVEEIIPSAPLENIHAITQDESPLLDIVDQEDIRPEDRALLNNLLMWLPPLCRENLRHLVVRYNRSAPRAQATSSSILIRGGMQESETIAVLTHECGHIIGLGALKGDSKSGESAYPDGSIPTYNSDPSVRFYAISWKNSEEKHDLARAEDFVSGYAKEDPFEDFAESFIMYALHNAEFRLLAERNGAITQKYAFMREVVFSNGSAQASEGTALNFGHKKRVWDTTKLAHNLVF